MKFVPNALTISRILLTPILLVMLMSNTLLGQVGALVLFIVAALSDYLDGELARRYGVRSRLGQFLDPFADKVLVLGTFVGLVFLIPQIVPWWAVALIAVRDVAITAMRMMAEVRGQALRTMPMAKSKTAVQLGFLIAILALLTARWLPGVVGRGALWLLESIIPFIILMVVVGLTMFTGLWYFFRKDYISSAKLNG